MNEQIKLIIKGQNAMSEKPDYKTRIYILKLDRIELAKQLGISYSTFNQKLGNFGNFTPEQESKLRKIIDDKEQVITANNKQEGNVMMESERLTMEYTANEVLQNRTIPARDTELRKQLNAAVAAELDLTKCRPGVLRRYQVALISDPSGAPAIKDELAKIDAETVDSKNVQAGALLAIAENDAARTAANGMHYALQTRIADAKFYELLPRYNAAIQELAVVCQAIYHEATASGKIGFVRNIPQSIFTYGKKGLTPIWSKSGGTVRI